LLNNVTSYATDNFVNIAGVDTSFRQPKADVIETLRILTNRLDTEGEGGDKRLTEINLKI
jgi:hypothetical protein